MAVEMRTCEHGEGLDAIQSGVRLLLAGMDADEVARWAEMEPSESWDLFLANWRAPIKRAMFASYQSLFEGRLEHLLEANVELVDALAKGTWQRSAASDHALALHVMDSLQGARHERLLERLGRQWREGETVGHPAVALAAKAATFRHPLPVAQAAYFFLEWRSQTDRRGSLEAFLQTSAATELIRVSPSDMVERLQFPFRDLKQHG